MTTKEAIELLDSFRICVAPTLREAMSIAISALRAQELANYSPELDNNFGELISRQAENYKICNACGMIDCDQMDKCKKVFTAQPEKCTETHSCDLISRKMVLALPKNKVRSLRTYEVVDETINVTDIEHLPSAQPETHWIPCNERLPEEYGNYLVSFQIDDEPDIGTYNPDTTKWSACDSNGFYWVTSKGLEVIAWMPLPEQYREGEG